MRRARKLNANAIEFPTVSEHLGPGAGAAAAEPERREGRAGEERPPGEEGPAPGGGPERAVRRERLHLLLPFLIKFKNDEIHSIF